MTYRIIYSSESSTPMQIDDLEDILEHARARNAAEHINGALVYVDGVFLQILEGDAVAVQRLMARIAGDVRHETVTVLKQGEIPTAVFTDWKMAYVSATAEQVARWAGLSATTTVPEILTDIRHDPSKVEPIVESILSVLAGDPNADPGTN